MLTPLINRYRSLVKIKKETTSDALVLNLDLAPTFIALAEQPVSNEIKIYFAFVEQSSRV